MRWLQATFSTRFNRMRNERGHVFQGRYQAPVVAPEAVGAVCHYIHLNPVRARVVNLVALAEWPWTSLVTLRRERGRPHWFLPREAPVHAGGLEDTPAGRKQYLAYLGWLQEDEAGQKALEFDRLSKDWAVGDRSFKKELLKEHRHLKRLAKPKEAGPRELSLELWAERLGGYLAALKKGARDIAADAKGAPWKVAMAAAMKTTTTASNPWLAGALRMGSPFRLSRLVSACREDPAGFQPHVATIAKCKV